jgi:hypothetical protein
MAELHILNLRCLNQEDSNANDEAALRIDGVMVSGPHPMATGDVVNVDLLHTFTGTVAVNLTEEDGAGVPDFIGTVVVPDTLQPLLDEIGEFRAARPHANYSMEYHIH